MSTPELTQLGRYRIVAELGRGAMGVVYRAQDPALDRAVAVKTIFLTGDAKERQSYEARFMQEARAAGRLTHPAIITIYDVGREGELAYMAMELLQGVDLKERLGQGSLSLRDAVVLALQVADGLAYAQEHGVVHRDIKPANIMILPGMRAKIMDFGLARLQLSDVKTQTGVLLGTPKYMSPEQVAGRAVDHRSDIFSLGGVLYEMLVGRPPFSGSDTAQLLHRIATASHAAPSRIVSDLPPILDLIVARALEKDPAARYQSAQELAADLQTCLAELPVVTSTPSAQPRADAIRALDATARIRSRGDGTQVLDRGGDVAVDGGELGSTAGTSQPLPSSASMTGPEIWPLARRFDSAAALQRLREPSLDDSARLTRVPRAAQGLELVWRDPGLRRVALILVASLVASLIVAVT